MSSTVTYLRDPYLEFLADEGLPIVEGFGVDLLTVDTVPWARLGANATFVHVAGRGDFVSVCVIDIPAGGSTAPQQHLFEEVIYVLEGKGATTIEIDGKQHTFEWGPKSLFALPLNAKYRHYNHSGSERARMASTMNLPIIMNLYRDNDFIFGGSDHSFGERVETESHFTGEGDLVPGPFARDMWETNFVPDMGSFDEMTVWEARGAHGQNMQFTLADGSLHAHMSEMPQGTYKKAHRHPADFHVFAVTGHGYSLFWYEGDADYSRVDWRHGVVFAPADKMFHQHFNTAGEPARYLATAFGSARYPILASKRLVYDGSFVTHDSANQIEYSNQDPRIDSIYRAEMATLGSEVRMGDLVGGA
jgi:quercetin dioxygenase-like cupin family protein